MEIIATSLYRRFKVAWETSCFGNYCNVATTSLLGCEGDVAFWKLLQRRYNVAMTLLERRHFLEITATLLQRRFQVAKETLFLEISAMTFLGRPSLNQGCVYIEDLLLEIKTASLQRCVAL